MLRAHPLTIAIGLALAGTATTTLAADGRIVDNDQALSHARVRIAGKTATTDADGRFHIDGLPAGNYTLEITSANGKHYDQDLHYDGKTAMTVDVERSGIDTMVVTADALRRSVLDMASPAEVLAGDKLVQRRESSLGETLNSMPGIQSSQFGPGASRPVIRGLDAARVRVLSDGVDVLDASNISPDHAVNSEPLLADRIEVLKGPATLLYGGGAIGGVVNVIDQKVPDHAPEDGVEGAAEVRMNTVANERAGVVGVTAGHDHFAVRVEGVRRLDDSYDIPGHAKTFPEEGEWNPGGTQPNSQMDTSTGTLGASYIGDQGYIGLAYTRQKYNYGLPAEAEEDGSGAYIAMDQKRWDLRGEYREPLPGFEDVKLRVGHTDYGHTEFESDGEPGTVFKNNATEGRLELTHEPVAGWHGVIGVQSLRRDFRAAGEEAYVPPTLTRNTGLFVLEEYEAGPLHYELGLRREHQTVDVDAELPAFSGNGTSASAGVTWKFAPDYSAALSYSRAERLPTAEELYADGPHGATETFEHGDPGLNKETAHNIDLIFRKIGDGWRGSIDFYHNAIDNYIFPVDTGNTVEDFREIDYTARDVVLKGVEAELSYDLSDWLTVTAFGDRTRGELKDGGNLPRMPGDRLGLRLNGNWESWSASLEGTRVARQDRLADFETPTDGYTMVNAGLSYHDLWGDNEYQVYLKANNLGNVEARNAVSFLKDEVPLPGRNLTLGVRLAF